MAREGVAALQLRHRDAAELLLRRIAGLSARLSRFGAGKD